MAKKEEKQVKQIKNIEEDFNVNLLKVAEKFKELRIKAGHTSHETFAYENEINRVQYWRVEKGSNITLTTFFKLLKIHKITAKEFFKDF